MKSRLFVLFFFVFVSKLAAQNANDIARFLAGLPVRGSGLEELARLPAWADHGTAFDDAWLKLEKRQLADIRIWGPTQLRDAYHSRDPMFYMFSGPDFLYAQAFFPNARTYILCGTEPVGVVPDVGRFSPQTLPASLDNLRRALNNVLKFSFFITKDMRVDLTTDQLGGTVPILLVFLARSGSQIKTVEMVSAAKSPGVKIDFVGPGGRLQTLYYYKSDLSDGPVNKSGFLKYCAGFGRGPSMLKAASYLMHGNGFNSVRSFLLAQSSVILQDDSGIPLKYLDPAKWQLRYFGSYAGPIDLFKEHYQPALAEAFSKSDAPMMYFGFGYQFAPKRAGLMIATPR